MKKLLWLKLFVLMIIMTASQKETTLKGTFKDSFYIGAAIGADGSVTRQAALHRPSFHRYRDLKELLNVQV